MPKASDKSRPPPKKPAKPDTAFDLWLARSLKEIFGELDKEPLPPELLKLINDDIKK